ncbi:MAG: aspartyl protease family protein [Acidobacteria bacterium]|nr:aspartyl protease family protein [Acidobacteriota bacterium]
MGMTTITAKVSNPADSSRSAEVKFLVDSGAGFSVVPSSTLQQLGIEPRRRKEFDMVDGQSISRQIGAAMFEYQGELTVAPVIFGEEGDATLMGATTLEGMGLVLDPLRRELRPMKLRI